MTIIKIINGKRGYYLKVNNLFISQGFSSDIKAIRSEIGIPYGATEWVSIKAIRNFWHEYMQIVISAINKPYRSVYGQLKFIPE